MKKLAIKKLYYSIKEVSEMTSVKPYVLRYWESEFSELRPSKNRAGNRIYRQNDIRLVNVIKKLLYNEKYTIEGAKQKIKKVYKGEGSQLPLTLSDGMSSSLLDELSQDLKKILAILDDDDHDHNLNPKRPD